MPISCCSKLAYNLKCPLGEDALTQGIGLTSGEGGHCQEGHIPSACDKDSKLEK